MRSDSLIRTLLRRARPAAALAVLLAAAGCVSAQKRLEQGMELEQRGRPVEAARRYIDALKKEPALTEARARLQETGDRAIQDFLAESQAYEGGGQAGQAADALLRLDELWNDARQVGVQLAVPADYSARRRATLDRAIAQAVVASASEAGRGQYGEALRWLERARERWQPSAAQQGELNRARSDVNLAWADGELRAGRFRAAYDRAEQAAQAGAGARARELQEEALARGTIRVAVLPLTADAGVRSRLDDDVLPLVTDLLDEAHWSRPRRFIDIADPAEVGREARRQGFGRRPPTTREAALLGQDLEVEWVVLAEVDSVSRTEADVSNQRRAARTTAGADTAYAVRTGRHELWVRVSYALIDVETRRVVEEHTVAATADARFRRGVYAGDSRTLTLTREERDLFDAGRQEDAERELAREISSGLAERLGRDVYSMLERRIR